MKSNIISIGAQVPDNFDGSMNQAKIASITVQYNKNCILGLGIEYEKDGQIINKNHNICLNEVSKLYYYVWEEKFSINDGDYLKEIRGHYNQNINSLQFLTYFGKESSFFGYQNGEPFLVSSYGDTFTNISGQYEQYLRKLNFKVQPLNYSVFKSTKHSVIQSAYPTAYVDEYVPSCFSNFNYPPLDCIKNNY